MAKKTAGSRAGPLGFLRGLTLGLSLSALNLVGMFFMLLLLGGLGGWSTAQFVGIFGVFEVATGVAFIFCPNAWRLPIVEVEAKRTDVQLAASTIFIPHWAGGAKSLAGIAMVAYAGQVEGWGPPSLMLVPFAALVAMLTLAISVAVAAWGFRHPGIDVLYFTISRPGRDDFALPGISLSASTLQILLGAFTLPTIKLAPPAAFYGPEFGAGPVTLLVTLAITATALATMFWAWRGRLSWRAPTEQQELAEQPA